VPESSVLTVHIGQQVEVNVPTMKRTFSGRVARFANKVALATRTMDTEVDVPNPSLVLVPGMYAQVDLTIDRRNRVVSIPVSAVDVDSEGDSQENRGAGASGRVLVVTRENKVELRHVTLGLETANKVEVRSGVQEGDMVVIGSRTGLQQGQHVLPKVTTMTASSS
jgi:multidrug efflux pump subunit AcrA (membrane-fusion protein)